MLYRYHGEAKGVQVTVMSEFLLLKRVSQICIRTFTRGASSTFQCLKVFMLRNLSQGES